jgi:hypothetical protein
LKLPKGVKKLKTAGSKTALADAIAQLCAQEFNGHIRVTAPQGVKEAGILVFIQSIPQLAVYQSPDRSVYGQEALAEIGRISTYNGSVVRAEAYFTHDLVEVDSIVSKMRKAAVSEKDLAAVGVKLPGAKAGAARTPPAAPTVPPAPAAPRGEPPAKRVIRPERPAPARLPAPPQEAPAKAEPLVPSVVKGPARPKAPAEDRLALSPRAAEASAPAKPAPAPRPGPEGEEGHKEFLKVLKEVGMSPPAGGNQAEGTISGDEIDQYIAAFETYIDKSTRPEAARRPSGADLNVIVDEIMDEMVAAAGDDEWTKGFIESQRDLVLDKVSASSEQLEGLARQRDSVVEERTTLAEISRTFQDVLRATEQESRKHKEELDRIAQEEGEDADWLKTESANLEQQSQRLSDMERVLAGVLSTHQRRFERLESELEEAEVETTAEVKKELVDLETLKKDFLEEMRDRIRGMSTTAEGAPSPAGAAKAARSISEGIHEQVEELEKERAGLEEEGRALEGEERAAQDRQQELDVDREVEVRARLEELGEREAALKKREDALVEMEGRLQADRGLVEEELSKSRSSQARLRALEAEVQRREDGLKARESELEDSQREIGDAETKLREVRATEARLKAREMQLVARESELTSASDRARKEREEEVELDLRRVGEMERELKLRQQEYSKALKESEGRIGQLQEELDIHRDRVKVLEGRLSVLQDAEARARRLEESIASGRSSAAAGSVDSEDLKRILTYLDDLLAHLPESKVEEFSQSEYFELYDRILRKLGI